MNSLTSVQTSKISFEEENKAPKNWQKQKNSETCQALLSSFAPVNDISSGAAQELRGLFHTGRDSTLPDASCVHPPCEKRRKLTCRWAFVKVATEQQGDSPGGRK
ncbi:hypothetical protein RUM44_010207 [Polyplax serrata]|uniref:Uncharacterized protein n=1 Tax=Polyplax serrata TaxID=468196 RepID=A0ABR1AWD6_POLSC